MKRIVFALIATVLPFSDVFCMVDPSATQETKDLYTLLQQINAEDGAAFGNEYSLFRGMYTDGTAWYYDGSGDYLYSDIQNICGIPPLISAWDINEFALSDGTWKDCNMKSIRMADAMGAICCLSFHENNPVTGGGYSDTDIDLADILPDGAYHSVFEADWSKAADMIGNLKRTDGTLIPVILRPFHELTGNWFWWGSQTDADEFIQLWQWLVTYLRDTRGLHNIIYEYNTGSDVDTTAAFLARWPGDAYVDIASCDVYLYDTSASTVLTAPLNITAQVAADKGIPAALAEVGAQGAMSGSTDETWWTDKVLDPLKDAGLFSKICLIAGWANWGTAQYHIPYPGDSKAADFKVFLQDDHILLLDRVNENAAWMTHPVLGSIYTAEYPWVYGSEQGWEYLCDILNPQNGSAWYYDWNLGWIWTSDVFFPYLWSSEKNWLYYGETLSNGMRVFYDFDDAAWINVPRN